MYKGKLRVDMNKGPNDANKDELETNHSHFVLVDTVDNPVYKNDNKDTRGRGGEIIPRARLEKAMSELLGYPLVQVVIGGGKGTMATIRASVEALTARPHRMPLLVVVVKGTGGKADDLAGLLADKQAERDRWMQERVMTNPEYQSPSKFKSGPCQGQT